MSKYDSLREHLQRQHAQQVVRSLDELSAVVPGGLPRSAYVHKMWWLNEDEGSHVQARAWLQAGWLVSSVDLDTQQVTFVKRQ